MARSLPFVLFIVAGMGCKKDRQQANQARDIGELINALRDGKPEEKPAVALEIGRRGPEAFKALPALVEALRSDDPLLRQNAAMSLGKIGPQATAAVDALIKILADSEWTVRRAAAMALGDIGDTKALSAVEALSHDPDSLVRKAAVESAKRLRAK